MYSISDVAARLGVARSTLLYYERVGLIKPQRNPDNGYRCYSRQDLAQLLALKQLQRAGLSLKECQLCLQGALPKARIHERLSALENELKELEHARALLSALSGEESNVQSRAWHEEFEQRAPDAHFQWLLDQGFSEMEALQIRWCSKDMSDNEAYMALFYQLFERMERQGPGDDDYARQILACLPHEEPIANILDMGCGTGAGALLLAEQTSARITALDNYQPFLDQLDQRAEARGVSSRIQAVNGSMFEPPFEPECFDLIWAEGSAYLMGFEQALTAWQPLLREGGYLFVTELAWFSEQPSPDAVAFFQAEYSAMQHAEALADKAQQAGYQVVASLPVPSAAWGRFYSDMDTQVKYLRTQHGNHRAFEDCEAEMDIYRHYGNEYGYQGLLLKKA